LEANQTPRSKIRRERSGGFVPTSVSRVSIAGALAFVVSTPAVALDWGVRADVGAARPLSTPQSGYFGLGFEAALGMSLELLPFLDARGGLAYSIFPPTSKAPFTDVAGAFGLAIGARAHRPFDGNHFIPFGSLDVGLVHSGVAGISLAPSIGVLIKPSLDSKFAFGPWVRFTQLFQAGVLPSRDSFNASVLSFGIT
jgi:hypothetical protein